MATGDFAWLKLQLAFMAGRNTVAELDANPNVPSDSLLAGQCINEAYIDCYLNPEGTASGGKRPGWALQTKGLRFEAPKTGSVTVTSGSTTISDISGSGVTNTMAGSVISIGQGFYTLASTTSIVEPCQEPTGSTAFQLWHNSYVMDATITELEFGPLVLGWGLLRAMNGLVESVKWRQITYGDFWSPTPFGVGQMTSINWPGGVSNPTGTPIFYYIDNSVFITTAAIANRMVIWPLPTAVTTVQYRAWVTPTELSADADLPIMPQNMITRVLLPLARERWVMTYKKYTGGNEKFIMAEADRARGVLNNSSPGQRDRAFRVPIHNC